MEFPSTSSPSATPSGAQHEIEMVFRFWSSARSLDTQEKENSFRFPGVLALIEDVAAAEQATISSGREQLSLRGLRRASDALIVSRQIQVGLQGYRTKSSAEPVAISIAIHSKAASAASAH